MQVYTLCFEMIIQLCVEKNDPCQEQGGWQIETVHWNRALCLRMRWDEVWQSAVPVTDTPTDRQEMQMGEKVRIVRVMHSLRLLSLVSHTVAPMHSPTTLSRRKNKLLLLRGGRWEENRSCCWHSKCPQWRGRHMTLSAGVNGVDVCNKAKRLTECPLLANKKMSVNKKNANTKTKQKREQGQAGTDEPPTSQPVLCVTKRIQEMWTKTHKQPHSHTHSPCGTTHNVTARTNPGCRAGEQSNWPQEIKRYFYYFVFFYECCLRAVGLITRRL